MKHTPSPSFAIFFRENFIKLLLWGLVFGLPFFSVVSAEIITGPRENSNYRVDTTPQDFQMDWTNKNLLVSLECRADTEATKGNSSSGCSKNSLCRAANFNFTTATTDGLNLVNAGHCFLGTQGCYSAPLLVRAISSNDKYTFCYRDKSGSQTYNIFKISKIDKTKPKITATDKNQCSSTDASIFADGWRNKEVLCEFKVEKNDNLSPFDTITTSSVDDNDLLVSHAKSSEPSDKLLYNEVVHSVSHINEVNSKYRVTAKDKAGNIETHDYVMKIDKTPPVFEKVLCKSNEKDYTGKEDYDDSNFSDGWTNEDVFCMADIKDPIGKTNNVPNDIRSNLESWEIDLHKEDEVGAIFSKTKNSKNVAKIPNISSGDDAYLSFPENTKSKYTLKVSATDNAGNNLSGADATTNIVEKPFTVKIDKDKPSFSPTLQPQNKEKQGDGTYKYIDNGGSMDINNTTETNKQKLAAHDRVVIDLDSNDRGGSNIDWKKSKIKIWRDGSLYFDKKLNDELGDPLDTEGVSFSMKGDNINDGLLTFKKEGDEYFLGKKGDYKIHIKLQDTAGNITEKTFFIKVLLGNPSLEADTINLKLGDTTDLDCKNNFIATGKMDNGCDIVITLRDAGGNIIDGGSFISPGYSVNISIDGQGASSYNYNALESGDFINALRFHRNGTTARDVNITPVVEGKLNFVLTSWLTSGEEVGSDDDDKKNLKVLKKAPKDVVLVLKTPKIEPNGTVNSNNTKITTKLNPQKFTVHPPFTAWLSQNETLDSHDKCQKIKKDADVASSSESTFSLTIGSNLSLYSCVTSTTHDNSNDRVNTLKLYGYPTGRDGVSAYVAINDDGMSNIPFVWSQEPNTSNEISNENPATNLRYFKKPSSSFWRLLKGYFFNTISDIVTGVTVTEPTNNPVFQIKPGDNSDSKVKSVIFTSEIEAKYKEGGNIITATYAGGNAGVGYDDGGEEKKPFDKCSVESDCYGYQGIEMKIVFIGADIEGRIKGNKIVHDAFAEPFNDVQFDQRVLDEREVLNRSAYELIRNRGVSTEGQMTDSTIELNDINFLEKDILYYKNLPEDFPYIILSGEVSGVGTIIAEDANIIIDGDLTYADEDASLGIILLNSKTENRPKTGNVFIHKDVQEIVGNYFIDGAFMTTVYNTANDLGKPSTYGSNFQKLVSKTTGLVNGTESDKSAISVLQSPGYTKQLRLLGSIISFNTLGGSIEKEGNQYYDGWKNFDDQLKALPYDLHFLRRYNSTVHNTGILGETNKHAFIIRQDGRLDLNPPPGFQ